MICTDSHMHKLLTFVALASSVLLGGCSSMGGIGDAIPNALDRMPLIYRPTIQQGNIITQEDINQLEPGMAKRQVRFVLGTPMLNDIFHPDRWDYVYTVGEGSRADEMKQVALYFEDDRLVRIEGDYRPMPASEQPPREKEVVVDVPDWEGERKGFWARLLDSVWLGGDD